MNPGKGLGVPADMEASGEPMESVLSDGLADSCIAGGVGGARPFPLPKMRPPPSLRLDISGDVGDVGDAGDAGDAGDVRVVRVCRCLPYRSTMMNGSGRAMRCDTPYCIVSPRRRS